MDKSQAKLLISQVRKTYNQIAEHFSLTRQKLWDDLIYFTPFIKDGQDVLDIGCGNGRLIELFKNYKINYVGIDSSKNLIEEARKFHHTPNIKIQFIVNDLLEVDLGENKYDVILLVAVLQHIPQIFHKEIINKINKSLKPNGVLLMTNWNVWQKKYIKYVISNLKNFLFRSKVKEKFGIPELDYGIKDVFISYQPGNDGSVILERYHYAFTKCDIKKLLKRNNFKILENLYTYNDKKSNILNAKNLLTIARKK